MLAALVLLFAAPQAAAPTFDQVYREGLIALQGNQLEAAEEKLAAAAKLQPGNGRVWVALARTYWKRHEAGKAEDAAEQAARFGSGDGVVLQNLATYYAEAGDRLKAADAQARYAALHADDQDASARAAALYFEATQPLLREQKFAAALEVLTNARKRLGRDAQIELAMGVAYYGLRRFDEAAGAFLDTIALAPDAEQAYLFLGRMLDSIPARLPEVTRRFAQFEAAHPADDRGYLLHAKALDAQGVEPETARKLLEQAIRMDASDAAAHVELATLLERMRRYPEAAAEFERAEALDANDPATHYHLARLYDRLNRPGEAAAQRQVHATLTAAQDAIR